MQLEYIVGSRVDGLYDGNNDDMWYPGRIQRINNASAANGDDDAAATYEVLYDDGEIEYQVAPKFLRVHVSGTLCLGTRVFGRYAGGDEWYPGKVTEVQENGCYTIEYDDTEVEADVPIEFIKEPAEAVFEPATEPEVATAQVEEEEEVNGEETDHGTVADHVEDEEAEVATEAEIPVPDEPKPVEVMEARSTNDEEAEESSVGSPSQREDEEVLSESHQSTITMQHHHQQPQQYEMERPRFHPKPKQADNGPPPQQQHRQPEAATNHFETDEYASIVESIELLGKRLADAASIKVVLSMLVKQMRAFPQVTADLVHGRNGERLVIDVLKFHDSHAVIQCYCFVLLRRLCFLCAKSTHYFLRNGIINFVTSAMRKFAEDAILQASACGALAVFTRVHAGLNLLLEHQVAQLVLATIVYHKTYSIHTRQVHYYACEVLLELCELGDRTTLDALCGDQVDAGLSDVSPISLLIFLLRQGLSFDDKKACCAVGTLLMCLAANNRYAAGLILRLNGLPELSTVMAKYPSEPGIQKYSASASKEIALSSIQKSPTTKKVKEMASEILQESGSLEDLHQERYHQANGGARYVGGEIKSSSRASASGRSQTPGVGKRKTAPMANHPSPTRGNPAISYKDPLSFSKFASPIGKAPYLPSNMTSFAAYPSSSMTAQQQRNSLVILDGANGSEQMFLSSSSHPYERKQFVKEERQSLLFETYGVQGGAARETTGPRTTQGIKRKQLKTHIVSAAESTWATPVVSPKKLMRDEILTGPSPVSSYGQPFSSRSNIAGVGSYALDSQQNYENMMDEPMEDATDYHYHHQSYRCELSPTTTGRAQPTKKKKKKSASSTARESFQVKIESETQLRISKEMQSPFASPMSPSHKRTKGSSTASKTGVRSTTVRGSSHGVQRSSAVKKHPPKTDLNAESLTAYAAKLFNEDFGFEGDVNGVDLRSGTSSNALSAREQAEIQERERLSFAEKLHKMIDKAKSTLAVSNVTSEPASRSSRSTTSSKAVNGAKILSLRPPAETSNPERLSAPAAKKTRVTSGSTTRKTVKDATSESASSSSPSGQPSSLPSASSQPKVQSQDVKRQTESKLSTLSTPKRQIGNLPTASAKSTATTTRTSKPDSARLTATPKSASKTRAVVVAPSTKSVKSTMPATQRGSKGVKEAHENSDKTADVEVDAKSVVAEEASQVDSAAPAIEPTKQAPFSVSSEISSQPPNNDDAARDNDSEVVSTSREPQEPAASLPVDEENASLENDQPAESEEMVAVSPEGEPVHMEEAVTANDTNINSSVDGKHHEDKAAAVEESTEVPLSIELSVAQSEVTDLISSEPESPTDADVVDNPNAETQPTVAQADNLDTPIAVETKDEVVDAPALQSDAAPPQLDAAPVDDIYADEYNEFDDDGAGDEAAEPSDMLDEQTADSDDHLGGRNVPLDELLSLADQIAEAASEVPPSADVSATISNDNTASTTADDVPPEAAESNLSSSKSGDDLYTDEANAEFDEAQSGTSSVRSTQDTEPPKQDLSGSDLSGSDAASLSGEVVQEEPQTEDTPQSIEASLAETSSAPEETPPAADTSVLMDVQPPIDADAQDSIDISSVADTDIPSSNVEDMMEKDSTETNSSATPLDDEGTEENKEPENAVSDQEAAQPLEDQSSPPSFEASAVDEATSSFAEDNSSIEATIAHDNEAAPPADEFVEGENAEDRPVSRGADSYAEDGFDFEPEEEEEKQPAVAIAAVEVKSSADQNDSESAEGDEQTPPSATDVSEPIETLEQPQEAAENSEGVSERDGDRGDLTEGPEETNQVTDVGTTQAESAETGEPDTRSDAIVASSEPVSSKSAVDASEANQEEPTPAAISASTGAEDVAPNDEGVETNAELIAEPAVAKVNVEAGENAEFAVGYGEDYGEVDFEEAETDEQSPPSVVEESEPIETVEQVHEPTGNSEVAVVQSEEQGKPEEPEQEEARGLVDVENVPADPKNTDDPDTPSEGIPASSDEQIEQPGSSESGVDVFEPRGKEEPAPVAVPASVDAEDVAPIDDPVEKDTIGDLELVPKPTVTNADDHEKEEPVDVDEYDGDYGEADFEETESSPQGDAPVSQSECPNSPTQEEPDADDILANDDATVSEALVADSRDDKQAEQQDDDTAAAAIDTSDESSGELTSVPDAPQSSDVEAESTPTNEVSDDSGDSTIPISSEEVPVEDNVDQSEAQIESPALNNEETHGQEGDEIAQTDEASPGESDPQLDEPEVTDTTPTADAVVESSDLQRDDAEDAVVATENLDSPVEVEPVSVDTESNTGDQQTLEAVSDDSTIGSGKSDLTLDTGSDGTEAPSATLEVEQGGADKYPESCGDESEFADAERDPLGKNPKLPTEYESPASYENEDADTTVQDSPEETKKIDQLPAEDTAGASAVQKGNASTSEDLDVPFATLEEDSRPEAIESDSPLESVPSSVQSEGDQFIAGEQVASNGEQSSLEPETLAAGGQQLEVAPASSDVQDSTEESSIDEPTYEDDYTGDADQPEANAPSEGADVAEDTTAAAPEDDTPNEEARTEEDTADVAATDLAGDSEETSEADFKSTTEDTPPPESGDLPIGTSVNLLVSNDVEETREAGDTHVDTGEGFKLDMESSATENLETNGADVTPAPTEFVEVLHAEKGPDAAADESYDDGEFEGGEASHEQIETGGEAAPKATESAVSSATEIAVDQSWEMLEAQALEVDSRRSKEGDTSSPVEIPGSADSIAEDVASLSAVETEISLQGATSADDQQGGDAPAVDNSSALDLSENHEAEIESTQPIILSDDDAIAVPQEEYDDKEMIPREPGVDHEKEDSTEPEQHAIRAADAVMFDNGDVQDDAQPTQIPRDEGEEVDKEIESVDIDAVPETATLSTEQDDGNSSMTDTGSSDVHETEVPLEETPAPGELSTESETRQSAPVFASYGDSDNQGDSEVPPPADEPTPNLEADVVETELITKLAQATVDDAVGNAEPSQEAALIEESEPPQVAEETAGSGAGHEEETEQAAVEECEQPAEPDRLPSEIAAESTEPAVMTSDEILEAENRDLPAEPRSSEDVEAAQEQDQVDPAVESAELSKPETVDSENTVTESEQPVSEEPPLVDPEEPASEQPEPGESNNSGDAEVQGAQFEADSLAPEVSVSLEPEIEVVPVEAAADKAAAEESAEQLDSALSGGPGETSDSEAAQRVDIGASGDAESESEQIKVEPVNEPTSQVAVKPQPEAETPKIDEYGDFEAEPEALIAIASVEGATDEVEVREGAEQVDSAPSEGQLGATSSEAVQPVEVGTSGDVNSEPEQTEVPPVNIPTPQVLEEQQPEAAEAASPKTDAYDDFEAEAEAVVAEIAVEESPLTQPAPESTDLYDDFEADAAEPVVIQVQPTSGDEASPAMGSASPGSDMYDEFEGEDEAPPAGSSSPPVEKRVEPTEAVRSTSVATESATANDEEYAEEAEYNDFEDEQDVSEKPLSSVAAAAKSDSSRSILSTGSTPREIEEDEEPPSTATVTTSANSSAKPKDTAEYDDDDYGVEEEFEDDEKPSAGTISPPKQTEAAPPATATATKPTQDNAENEYETDYDAEYDDFEE